MQIISSLENSNSELIIAGNFNINFLKLNENIYSSFFNITQSLPSNNPSHLINKNNWNSDR